MVAENNRPSRKRKASGTYDDTVYQELSAAKLAASERANQVAAEAAPFRIVSNMRAKATIASKKENAAAATRAKAMVAENNRPSRKRKASVKARGV